jgi:hypothetical protein
MNKEAVLRHLTEAAQQLASTIDRIRVDPGYGLEEYRVEMGHLYHHLNTAWNGRDCTDEQSRNIKQFYGWRKFPDESELFL